MVGQVGGHGGGAEPLLSGNCFIKRQPMMNANEMVVAPTPFHMDSELLFLLGQRPGFSSQTGDHVAKSQVPPFYHRGANGAGEAQF